MSDKRFIIYNSSAGSGKTFTLAKSYLRLLFTGSETDDAFYFSKILAMTFTNDAAWEMKHRILQYLGELSDLDQAHSHPLQDLIEEIMLKKGYTFNQFIQKAKAFYTNILQEYSSFNIKTIDSFTNQLTMSFTQELDLPFKYEILLDTKTAIKKTVDGILAKYQTGGSGIVSQLLSKKLEELTESGSKVYDFFKTLVKNAGILNNDQGIIQIKEDQNFSFEDWQKFRQYVKENYFRLKTKNEHLIALIRQTINSYNTDHINFKNSGIKSLSELAFKDFDLEKNSTSFEKISGGRYLYAKKTAEASDKILLDQIGDLLGFLSSEHQNFNTLKHIYKDIDSAILLKLFYEEYSLQMLENEQSTLSEFNVRIKEHITREPIAFIYERLGERFQHILVDEFQDTSTVQFFNLLPLLSNCLETGGTVHTVGDAKQAIYRFRGGDTKLLTNLIRKDKEKWNEDYALIENESWSLDEIIRLSDGQFLEKNYRSYAEIIDFNNTLFEFLIRRDHLSENLKNTYHRLAQEKTQKTKTGGAAFIHVADKAKKAVYEEYAALKTVEIINALTAKGHKTGDIAVLIRKNKQVNPLSAAFEESGIPFRISSVKKLSEVSEISLLMDLLSLKLFRDHQMLRYQIAHTLKDYIKISDFEKNLMEAEDAKRFIHQYLPIFDESVSLVDFFEKSITALKFKKQPKCYDALNLFLDQAYHFVQKNGNACSLFFDTWTEEISQLAYSSNYDPDAVLITSIHKSKGLQFGVVIVPFADLDFEKFNKNSSFLSSKILHEKTKEIEMPKNIFLNYDNLKHTYFEDEFLKIKDTNTIENLNVLYVACTRAVQELHLIFENDKHFKEIFAENKFPNQYFDWSADKCTSAPAKSDLRAIEPATKLKFAENIALTDTLKIRTTENQDDNRLYGQMLHGILERIHTSLDLDKSLAFFETNGQISIDEKMSFKVYFNALFELKSIKEIFDPAAEIMNELEIIAAGAKTLRPDRVVILPDGTCCVADYKTGAQNPAHIAQVSRYKAAMHEMGFKNVKGMIIYLHSKPFAEFV